MTFRSSLLYASRLIFAKNNDPSAKSNGRRSLFGAMLCIGISLVPLVAVLVISDGMIQGITGRMIGLSSRDICVSIDPDSSSVETYEAFLKTAGSLKQIDGITNAFPEIQGTALAAGKTARTGATVRAVQNDLFTADKSFSSLFKVVEGTTKMDGKKDAVIGQKIAELLNIHAGDTIRLITINQSSTLNVIPKVSLFKVRGIVSCGYQELDALWVFIPLETGFSVLPVATSEFNVGLTTPNPFAKTLVVEQGIVQDALFGNGAIPPVNYAYAYRWDEMNSSEYENFSSTKALLLLIMLLIVLVASVNISSALIMLVMERRREIAIIKSVGGTAEGLTSSFLLAGFAAGAGGVLMGIPTGLLAAVNINGIISVMEKGVNVCAKFVYLLKNGDSAAYSGIHLLDPAYYLQQIPVSVPFNELFIIAAGTMVLSLAVSAVPAIRAGREKPLDTLRKM